MPRPQLRQRRKSSSTPGAARRLVGPLFAQFTEQTGIPLQVRYGESAELRSSTHRGGGPDACPGVLSRIAGALGAVSAAGLLAPCPMRRPGSAGGVSGDGRHVDWGHWSGPGDRVRRGPGGSRGRPDFGLRTRRSQVARAGRDRADQRLIPVLRDGDAPDRGRAAHPGMAGWTGRQ
jgi:hypothetical protein